MVSGLCAVVATSQTDGAALIVWYVHRGGGWGEEIWGGNMGWGEEWFPGIAQQNKEKRAGGKQLVVKHRGKLRGKRKWGKCITN